ncbi:FKBP-type peptidyl-prolyl cis-trans isomerase [Alloalcanivorax xenomutans]|jgi:FKBP-type peptidyl-prolyl cis-trans isomerase SlpA|uniref:FKBP-type peptidyl-prolyl cis-trans isomerase n=1 Tax=Alloalcanivorax xenomutans TaxID=1094342 RepID=UPI0003B91BAF|nr:FKBP-type peptidyl-prolyl cis-trans isomerase [Alloalcanivorax xenomutans]ERS11256.1 peptidyl-prolyl cis-trans isomerase [Alcanivorax sp. PN-3]KYZ87654.1 peptidylprolyl isomerase [Alcanivorax sp. KX64203]PHS61111.1 MAG: peptidylprolyl isomerase [Alcanivorax sp.]WOA30749.1 FKBP-type peptidyl-prolyl cis-trans isomerase [Alloalcanivorax xenomutans]CUR46056.1 FKBP-type peptidyl-prolyl cis-trans isomerase SlpA [Alloalcanivorax xenomutans]
MNDELRVGPQTRITLHFAVRLMDGTEMDSTFGGEPATFVWGDGSLLPGFERAILGLKAGDRRSVFIDAQSGFGEYNEQNVQHFRRDTFAAPDGMEVGTVMNFADAAGAELPGVVSALDEQWVTVDFNHPLAGRELTFEVEIVRVEHDAPEQTVKLN